MILRAAERLVRDALIDTPVVLIQGPRQTGKSTLAQRLADEWGRGRYVTLDDPTALAEASHNPSGFLRARGTPLAIDEIQRAPELFLALKLEVDRDRRAGSYLLTGSANVLLLPKVADSLAGRMEPIELLPLSQAEIEGSGRNFVDELFSQADPTAVEFPSVGDLMDRMARGGFPEPSARATQGRRDAWFGAYMRTVLERDVRDMANIAGLTQMPRLFALLAARSGATLNIASLSVETGIAHTTLTRYVDLLRALFLVLQVPAWSASLETRLAKAGKAYLVDTGLLCYAGGFDPKTLLGDPLRLPPLAETFVANELQKLIRVSDGRPSLFHLRTVKHKEVDFVLEGRDGRIVGIDVRMSPAVTAGDAEGLSFLAELTEERFHLGVLLYGGSEAKWVGPKLVALPISSLWAP